MTLAGRALAGIAVVGILLGTVAGGDAAALPRTLAGTTGIPTIVLGGLGGDTPLSLKLERLAPGSSRVARYILRRGQMFAAGGFSVVVAGVEDYERDCGHSEINSGDTTCGNGPDQGELSRQLLVGHAWSSDIARCAYAAEPAVGAPMSELENVVLAAPAAGSAQDAVCLVLTFMLPTSADNLVQSDQVRLDLRLGLTGAQPSGAFGGGGGGPVLSGGTTGGVSQGGSQLPVTGTFLGALGLLGAVLVGLGGPLLLAARRRSLA